MKKISYLLIALLALAVASSCKKEEPKPVDPTTGGLKLTEVVAAATDFYTKWEEERNIPTSFTAAGKEITPAQFICAEAQALVNIAAGKKDDIALVSYAAASNPDRDSYTSDEVQVVAAKAKAKETLVEIAQLFLDNAAEKKAVPNQTNVYDGGADVLAFSTNRLTVTVARALAAYAEKATLPASVSTEYLPATTSLKAFAEQFVKYLDIYEKTIADKLSADGSHCSNNNNAWERVHFVPIPYDTPNDYKNEGKDQYDFAKYGNPWQFEIEGTTYTAAQCWEVGIRGLFDLCTAEGASFPLNMGSERNKAYTLANGKSLLAAPISRPSENCIWGAYPWYESSNDGGAVKYNGEPIKEVDINFLLKCGGWHICRAFYCTPEPLGKIGNFQQFGTDPAGTLVLDGCEGLISPMREFLIAARFYKYILDNNITKNVYDALKNVKVSFEMYDQKLPVSLDKTSLSFEANANEAQIIKVSATDPWSITSDADWISFTPNKGAAGESEVVVTVAAWQTEAQRTGTLTFTAGDYSKAVSVTQNAYVPPVAGTIMDFAKAFSTVLDVWTNTVGMVEADGTHCCANGTEFKDVHLVPIVNPNAGYKTAGNQYDETLYPNKWSAKIGDKEFSTNQCWEIAIRGLLDMCTTEGSAFLDGMTDRNKAYTLGNGVGTNAPMPNYSSANAWNAYPWYEGDKTVKDGDKDIETVDVNFILKVGSWHVVRSFIKVGSNNPLGAIGNYQEFGTTSGTLNLGNYVGLIAPMRELLILARVYKYIADNNITTNVYDALKDQQFSFDLYGDSLPKVTTIKDFATEYVKLLDVWQKTTGDVQIHESIDPYKNVHYIPMDTKITVGGNDLSVSQALEVAMRSYMLLNGKDGNSLAKKGANNFPAVDPVSMSAPMPANNNYGYSYWYMETPGNGGPIRYEGKPNTVNPVILLNYSERNLNFGLKDLGGSGNWSNVSGYNNNGNFPNHPEFTGCLVSGRVQMAFLNVFKTMLEKNMSTFDAAQFPTIDCTLWGVEAYD